MTTPTTTNPYDATPYASFAYAASHPGRMAAIATLFGRTPPDPARARVLEIGCASGGNLLPLASTFPNARFVGLDYSQVQIAQARSAVEQLGLTNIEFRDEDIRSVAPASLGQFDYIIAHGIYSWLPPDTQAALLALYRDCLTDDGIAYISYNTLPGWRMRGIIRDMMLFHAELFGDTQSQVTQAKALLDFMATHVPQENNPYGQYLANELKLYSAVNDSYLAHDHLEVHNEALYFRDFMRRAQACGLDYLGESEFGSMVGHGLSAPAVEKLQTEIKDIIRLEQYFDFLSNRSFRMTLLVKQGTLIQRAVTSDRLETLHVVAGLSSPEIPDLDSGAAAVFTSPSGATLQTGNPITKAALLILKEATPGSRPFPQLLEAARKRLSAQHQATVTRDQDATTLGNDLLIAYINTGLLSLQGVSTDAATTSLPLAQPIEASRYARWQATTTNTLTNLKHETVLMNDPCRLVLQRLDGTGTRETLLAAFYQMIIDKQIKLEIDGQELTPTPDDPRVGQALDAVLSTLAANALLLRDGAEVA